MLVIVIILANCKITYTIGKKLGSLKFNNKKKLFVNCVGDMNLCHTNEYLTGRRYIALLYLRDGRLEPNDREILVTPSIVQEVIRVCGVESRKPDWSEGNHGVPCFGDAKN